MITKVFMLQSAYQDVTNSHYALRDAIMEAVEQKIEILRERNPTLADEINALQHSIKEFRTMPIVPYADSKTGSEDYD